jgi:hypothetical protein
MPDKETSLLAVVSGLARVASHFSSLVLVASKPLQIEAEM